VVAILIRKADPREASVRALIEELDDYQARLYPAESNFGLDIESLSQPEARLFWAAAGFGCMRTMRR
jgi:hypothetical protein